MFLPAFDLLELDAEAIALVLIVDEVRAAAALAPAVGRDVAGLAALMAGALIQRALGFVQSSLE